MPRAEEGSKKGAQGAAPQRKAQGGGPRSRRPRGVPPDFQPPDFQLHPTFPAYPWWVIDKLVGIYANDRNNVVVHIVARWIDENQDSLGGKEITSQRWREWWRESHKLQGIVKDFPPNPDKKVPPDAPEVPPDKPSPETDGDRIPDGKK